MMFKNRLPKKKAYFKRFYDDPIGEAPDNEEETQEVES